MNWKVGLIFLLSLGACQKAANLSFSEEKMIEVMTDMQLAEASMQRLTRKIKDTLSQRYYREIYEIHGIEEEDFLHSLKALEGNPKMAKRIYDAVLERITKKENEMENPKRGEPGE